MLNFIHFIKLHTEYMRCTVWAVGGKHKVIESRLGKFG